MAFGAWFSGEHGGAKLMILEDFSRFGDDYTNKLVFVSL